MKASKYFEPLAAQVAGGSTIKAAAEAIGCAPSTAYNISANETFRRRVAAIRTEAVAASVGKLTAAASKSVDTLVDLLDEKHDARERLAAAKAILATLAPLSEFGELRSRIDQLETQNLRIAQ